MCLFCADYIKKKKKISAATKLGKHVQLILLISEREGENRIFILPPKKSQENLNAKLQLEVP